MMHIYDKEKALCAKRAEEVYFTLLGEACEPVSGVENAFADGSVCDRCYSEMLDAYERLRDRLGVAEEDADVEIIKEARNMMVELVCREWVITKNAQNVDDIKNFLWNDE